MASVTQTTNEFFDKFLKHSKRMVEFGLAHLFVHPELFPTIDVELKKIKGMELIAKNNPEKKQQCVQFIQRAYFNYLVKLTKFGFQYVKNNPEYYRDVAPLRKLLMEYEKDCAMKTQKPMKARRNLFGATSSDDYIWEQTFHDISALNDRLDAFRNRLNAAPIHTEPGCDANDKTLKQFNKQLEDKLKDIREKKQHRKEPEKNGDQEALNKINDRLEKLLKEIDDKKQTRPTGQRKDDQVINIDSDTNSSEVLISFEQFARPLKEQQMNVQSSVKPRAGTIERHLVIPIEANETPKITPRFCIKKSPVNGKIQVDLKLNFEDGILYHDKLVDGIWIENALPVQNFRNKVK